jgi:hypothetical protein
MELSTGAVAARSTNSNPLADPSIRRYGCGHGHAFEQDRLVVGQLTAASRNAHA